MNLSRGYKVHFVEGFLEPYVFDGIFGKVTYKGKRVITPNFLSMFRFLALFVPAAYLTHTYHAYLAAFTLMLAAVIMDILDGSLARYWEMITKFGAYFDPVVDKISIVFFPLDGAIGYQGATLAEPTLLLLNGLALGFSELILFVIAMVKLFVLDRPGSLWYVEKDGSNTEGKAKMVIESVVVLITLLAMHLGLNLEYIAPLYLIAIYYAAKSIIGHLNSIKRKTAPQN